MDSPPAVVADQVWEKDGHQVRVVSVAGGPGAARYLGGRTDWRPVQVRDLETGAYRYFGDERDFVAVYRFVGNRMADDVVLFRLTDLVRRTGVSDAERLIDALETLVRKRASGEAHADTGRDANSGSY